MFDPSTLPIDVVYYILILAGMGTIRNGSLRCPAKFIFKLDNAIKKNIQNKLKFAIQTVGSPSKPQHRIILPINDTKYFEIRRSDTELEVSVYDDPFQYRQRKTAYDTWKMRELPQRELLTHELF